jgi:hypothetical protein
VCSIEQTAQGCGRILYAENPSSEFRSEGDNMNRKRLFLSSFFLGAVLIAPMAITANAAPQRNEQVNAQTYTGKINKKEDQYILENKDKKSSYKLDDATKAEKFNGDNVKVVGTLDTPTNMIHVLSIEKLRN